MKKHWVTIAILIAAALALYWIYKQITGAVSGVASTISSGVSSVVNAPAAVYNAYSNSVDNLINGQSQDIITSPALPLPGNQATDNSSWFSNYF